MNANARQAHRQAQAPDRMRIARRWLRENLFSSAWNTLLTLGCGVFAVWAVLGMLRWGLIDAVGPGGTLEDCKAASGACWAFLREKSALILTGTYPQEERGRAYAAAILMTLVTAVAAFVPMRLWIKAALLAVTAVASYMLLRGGVAGMPVVESARWNGLPLILFLSVFTLAAAFPVGVILALVRWKGRGLPQQLAIGFIEGIRAIPMVAVLFAGVFILPLAMPQGTAIEPVLAILIVLTFFHAAYLAEDVRAGLQSLPVGQSEAAASLGLSPLQTIRLVVLPQALRVAVPGITNTVIGGFKDTSLVAIVGMHDLMSTARMAYADPLWQAYALEGNLAIALFYFLACWVISDRGQALEKPRRAGALAGH